MKIQHKQNELNHDPAVLTMGKIHQNWNYRTDAAFSCNNLRKDKLQKTIQKITKITEAYSKEISSEETQSDIREEMQRSMAYYESLLAKLHQKAGNDTLALQCYLRSFSAQKQFKNYDINLLLDILSFLKAKNEIQNISEVVEVVSQPNIFDSEGYEFAWRLYHELYQETESYPQIKPAVERMGRMLNLTNGQELKHSEYILFLFKNGMANFIVHFLSKASDRDIQNIAKDGVSSLLSILRQLDLWQSVEEPYLNFERFYQISDRFLSSTGDKQAIQDYIVFLKKNKRVLRCRDVEKMLAD